MAIRKVGIIAIVIFGAFVLGMVPLLTTFSSVDTTSSSIETRQGSRVPSEASRATIASPLELPAATSEWDSAQSLDCPSTDLRVLVVAGSGEESTLAAIRQALAYMGTPYTLWVSEQNPGELTSDMLANGCRGFYQGIILANGEEVRRTLTDEEWQALRDYEAGFDIRQLVWYTYPTPEYGLQNPTGVSTSDNPIDARFTNAGEDIFPYVNSSNPLKIENAYAYLASPVSDGDTTPLLTDADANVLAAVRERSDGTESLALTFDTNWNLRHGLVLSYGLINWVTKGLFLGERRVYLSAQVDDIFLPNVLYGTGGDTYRMTEEDLQAILDWQKNLQAQSTTEQLRLDLVFNSYGTTGVYTPDTLTPAAVRHQDEFKWINHTNKHLNWNDIGYNTAEQELARNNEWARTENLKEYDQVNLVTPEYSGLENLDALQGAYDSGVRYVVGDTSLSQFANPSPNAGFYHPLQPSIFVIPRYPNNVGYDVSTLEQFLAQYNDRYRDANGRDLSYDEALETESDVLLTYLLLGDINPWMFHQANLRAYDGTNTLIGDVIGRTLEKYNELFNLPVLSPTMDETGQRMVDRSEYNDAEVKASVAPGQYITLTAQKAARVPVTGLRTEEAELYGGQYISDVTLSAGESVTLPLE